MPNTTQIEKQVAQLQAELAKKKKALEAEKQAQQAEEKAKKVKGVMEAWDRLCAQMVKGGLVKPVKGGKSARGKKIAETAFNRKCYAKLADVVGASGKSATSGGKRKRLSPAEKSKIQSELKAGGSTAKALAQKWGVSVNTINNIKAAAGLTKKRKS
jgi:hypothetical protein